MLRGEDLKSEILDLRSLSVMSDSKETHKASFTVQASVSYLDFKVSDVRLGSKILQIET